MSAFRTNRRQALKLGLGGVIATSLGLDAFAQTLPQSAPLVVGSAAAPSDIDLNNFSFDALSTAMRLQAGRPYEPASDDLPDMIEGLDYDSYRRVLFRRERTVWADGESPFQLQPFFPGFLYKATTRIFVGDGQQFELMAFTGEDFEFLGPLDPRVFEEVHLNGVAGFRLNNPIERPDRFDEVVSFLGASYFRALGRGNHYGLSARGLALNTASSVAEEFPRFTSFFIVRPQPGDARIRIFAALDSPSVTGAYAFTVDPGMQTVIEVTKRLFFRQEVSRLGVAPLTSMYLFGENNRRRPSDFRPEVHDSDGLVIQRASGERLWRPLQNPGELAISYFRETSPRSFGLVQRDRNFSNYQDVEARYETRPSLVIEPMGDWGRGVVQLVEIPSDSEANDNIVSFWVPDEPPAPGSAFEFRYRMRWGVLGEGEGEVAMVTATHMGVGGNAAATVVDSDLWRFEINFSGGTAANLPEDTEVTPHFDVPANVTLTHLGVSRLPDGGWRISAEMRRQDSMPAELRARLSFEGRPLSETWLYQWRVAL